ncbi:MAG: hypothetical protein ACHQK8_00945 [Bacteroidia bacterium]
MKNHTLAFFILLAAILFSGKLQAQVLPPDTSMKDIGVAVSPAHLTFNVKPGESKVQEVTVTNETRVKRSFKISMKDFDMDKSGRSTFLHADSGKHSLSKWTNLSPTFFELAPGTAQKVRVTVNIPDTEGSNKAVWNAIWVEEAKERQVLETEASDQKIAFGITPVFAFGVWVYQNPPNVANKKVEIKNFTLQVNSESKSKSIELTLVNIGDGIAQCNAYVELTNTNTGKTQRLLVKRFTILPGYTRNYLFNLPDKLDKGNYDAVGVLDYGSKEEVIAAELKFKIE